MIAEGILDDLDIGGRHRYADRYFVEAELRRFPGRDTEIAVERRDQPAGDRMPVHRCNRRTRVLENSKIRRAVISIPLADLVQIATSEDVEAVLEVDPRRENIALSSQDNRVGVEVALQPIERVVQVSEEAVVLNVRPCWCS